MNVSFQLPNERGKSRERLRCRAVFNRALILKERERKKEEKINDSTRARLVDGRRVDPVCVMDGPFLFLTSTFWVLFAEKAKYLHIKKDFLPSLLSRSISGFPQ